MKIGLLVIATGKYDAFVHPLYESVKKHFFKDDEVKMYVFSDKKIEISKNVITIYIAHEEWPMPTLKRYHYFFDNKNYFQNEDFLFYCDVDMLFVSDISKEVLPDTEIGLVGTAHPGFTQWNIYEVPYERREESTAFVKKGEGKQYFAGGFNGGSREAFLKMSEHIKNNIDKDFGKNIIAIWHDESHMNRYFINNSPKVLSPSYCYPEELNIPFEKKLLALNKKNKHDELRAIK